MSASAGTALVVIDLQVAIVDGEEPTYRRDELLETVSGLLAEARKEGVPVIFIQHTEDKYEPLSEGNPGWQVHPRSRHCRASELFRSALPIPLRSPPSQWLDALGITHIVVAGMQTEMCVDTTSRRAVSLGYDVTLVADAHSTFDTEVITAEQIIAHTQTRLSRISRPAERDHRQTLIRVTFGAKVAVG